MAGKKMTALELRKKALLLESDLNRLRLRAELQQLREATDLTQQLKHLPQRFGLWGKALVPLAGIVAAFGLRRAAARGGLVGTIVSMAPSVIRLWRAFSAGFEETK